MTTATSPILSIPQVAPNQNQKEVTINNAIALLEASANAALVVALTGNAASVSQAQLSAYMTLSCSGLTGAGTLTVPVMERLFIVDNSSDAYGITVSGSTGTSSVFVSAAMMALVYCDGTNFKILGGGASSGGSGSVAGVVSFNKRDGAVTLSKSDVTSALGYVPPSAAITSITVGDGLSGGTITSTGEISLAPIAANSLLANVTTDTKLPVALKFGANFQVNSGVLNLIGLGTGSVSSITFGNGLTGGTITSTGDIGLEGAAAATAGQGVVSDGAGGITFITAIPAADAGHLLGASGTAGTAAAVSIGEGLSLSGGALGLSLTTPSAPSDPATKSYVDALFQGMSPKPSAAAATTAPLPANIYSNGSSGVGANLVGSAPGALVVDGVTLVAGQHVLVRSEAAGANNGLYVVTNPGSASVPYTLTRDASMDAPGEFVGGVIAVEAFGTTLANSLWFCTNEAVVTPGTTAVTFTQVNSATSLSAGAGLTISANSIGLTPIAPGTLFGNSSAGALAPAAITLGSGFSLSGGVLANTASISIQSADSTIGPATTLDFGTGITVSVSNDVATISISAAASGGLTEIGAGELLANITTGSAIPAGTTLGAFFDAALGATHGSIAVRSDTGWTMLPPGTAGQYLQIAGAESEPAWVTPSTSEPYDVLCFYPGLPSGTALRLVVPRVVQFASGLPGSFADVDVGATVPVSFTITQNGATIGTVSFAAGALTGTFNFSAAITFAAGDILRIVGPTASDATLSNLSITLVGTR